MAPPPSNPSAPAPGPRPSLFDRQNIPNLLTVLRLILAIALFALLTPWRFDASSLASGRTPDPWLLAAAALFVVAALTDALDGYLARRWNAVSAFGRIMDPFADKLLVIGSFVFLAGPGFWWDEAPLGFTELADAPIADGATAAELVWFFGGVQVSGVLPWMVAVILGRELLVTSIRGSLEGQGIAFPASASGKWKMILQSITIPAILVLVALGGGYGELRGPHLTDGHIPSAAAGAFTIAIRVLVWATVIVTVWSGIPYIIRAVEAVGSRRGTKGG